MWYCMVAVVSELVAKWVLLSQVVTMISKVVVGGVIIVSWVVARPTRTAFMQLQLWRLCREVFQEITASS